MPGQLLGVSVQRQAIDIVIMMTTMMMRIMMEGGTATLVRAKPTWGNWLDQLLTVAGDQIKEQRKPSHAPRRPKLRLAWDAVTRTADT
jgi:hypothetical protein